MKNTKYLYFGILYIIMVGFFVCVGYGFYLLFSLADALTFILIAFYLVNLIFGAFIFAQKRQTQAKLSWLMIIIAMPILGAIIFLIFGTRFRGRISYNKYHEKETFTHEKLEKIDDEFLSKQSFLSQRAVYETSAQLFNTGDKGFDALFSDIKNAKKFIHMQYYIIKPGEIYETFKYLLIQKAKEGLDIRLIVDDFGRWAMPWYEIKELRENKINVAIFGKVHFPFIGSSNGYRTHRKMTIIDGTIAHVGGINIANEYANISSEYGLWLDYQVKLSGGVVRSLELLFIEDWKYVKHEKLDVQKYIVSHFTEKHNSQMVLLESSPEINEPILQNSILSMILSAKKSIVLVTPYLVPTPEIEAAIRTAALSGIDVRIYIPGKPDKKSVFVGTRSFAKTLTQTGVKVYEQSHMLLHSKFGIFDGENMYFGTANIDMRSIYSQFEFIIAAKGEIIQQFEKLIKEYELTSRLLKPNDFKMSWFRGRISRLYVNLFSSIM